MLSKLADITNSQMLRQLHDVFPTGLAQAHKLQSINRDKFTRYVVCQLCHSTYSYDTVINTSDTEILKCSFVRFPRHVQRRMREPCSQPLAKKIRTKTNKIVTRPIKVFCYSSCIQYLQDLFQRPGITDLLNHWRNRNIPPGVMADIYDGAVWKSFLDRHNNYFFENKNNLGLLINIDFFQPYKHVRYSVGAIYLAILNFPRHLRYRKENMILLGIIPGPHEPKLTVNSFLEPLVLELVKLWEGIEISTPEGKKVVHAAIICNSSDVPACRKVSGFVGHSAAKACSRCLKDFPTEKFGDKSDYSGFDRDTWPERSVAVHRAQGFKWKHAQSLAERHIIEKDHGVRFTELLRLDYFETVRFSVVDPMHNILLGTTKHMITIWKEKKLLPHGLFEDTQSLVDKFNVPPDVGRIPHKISSGYSSFTADQWKNWTILFSLVALKDILPVEHYDCWRIFVQACTILCSRALSQASIMRLDELLLQFCHTFEQLYGAECCYPNLHLHLHITECILDYGPPNSFWLFACERLNGILGAVPTNHQNIEPQLMRKFISNSNQQIFQTLSYDDNQMLQDLFESVLKSKGSLQITDLPELSLPQLSLNT